MPRMLEEKKEMEHMTRERDLERALRKAGNILRQIGTSFGTGNVTCSANKCEGCLWEMSHVLAESQEALAEIEKALGKEKAEPR